MSRPRAADEFLEIRARLLVRRLWEIVWRGQHDTNTPIPDEIYLEAGLTLDEAKAIKAYNRCGPNPAFVEAFMTVLAEVAEATK